MKTKQTPKFKKQELQLIEKAAKEKQRRCRSEVMVEQYPQLGLSLVMEHHEVGGRAPTSTRPVGVPGKQASAWKHNLFSALAAATSQSAKAAKK